MSEIPINPEQFNTHPEEPEQHEIPEGKPMPVTLEVLLNNKDILEKAYQKLTTKVTFPRYVTGSDNIRRQEGYGQAPDYEGLIDFGTEYEATNLETLFFYIGRDSGLRIVQPGRSFELERQYLILLYEDNTQAEQFLKDKLASANEASIKAQDLLLEGKDLSGVIPGAPELVTTPFIRQEYHSHAVSRPTPKVDEIMAVKGELENIFQGKTVVDLAAGEEGLGFTVSKKLKAKDYVAVEPFNTGKLYENIHSNMEIYVQEGKLSWGDTERMDIPLGKVHVAKTDIKSFLEHLPDNVENVVFLISGVDEFILGTYDGGLDEQHEKIRQAWGNQYIEDVNNELRRVLGKNSTLVVYESSFGFHKSEGIKENRLETRPRYEPGRPSRFPVMVYEKEELN